jgi:hypothetical protein
MDPLGRFFFVGWGGNIGAVDSCVLSPVDGTGVVPCNSLQLGFGILPDSLVAENSGKFLYVTRTDGTVIYSIDQTTGALNFLQGPISTISFPLGSVVADPMGPFLYSLSSLGVRVHQVNQQSGNLAEIPGSPFNVGMTGINAVMGLAISATPIQAISGPANHFSVHGIFRRRSCRRQQRSDWPLFARQYRWSKSLHQFHFHRGAEPFKFFSIQYLHLNTRPKCQLFHQYQFHASHRRRALGHASGRGQCSRQSANT